MTSTTPAMSGQQANPQETSSEDSVKSPYVPVWSTPVFELYMLLCGIGLMVIGILVILGIAYFYRQPAENTNLLSGANSFVEANRSRNVSSPLEYASKLELNSIEKNGDKLWYLDGDDFKGEKENSHGVVNTKLEFSTLWLLSPRPAVFMPHGTRVCRRMINFIESQYWESGYEEFTTPMMYNMLVWETLNNYMTNMFDCEVDQLDFGVKPINSPSRCLSPDHRVRSYRDFPLRLADFGVLHHNEYSGDLRSLTGIRRFQQDDAHIFCMESQIKDEVKGVLEFITHIYKIFGFNYELKLSTGLEKDNAGLEHWEIVQGALVLALNESKQPWEMNESDGAMNGPQIDITVSDARGRNFQCGNLQLDFELPKQFETPYSAEETKCINHSEKPTERERIVVIRIAVLGSIEPLFAKLLDHYQGKWPFWLSPRQILVCPQSIKSLKHANEVRNHFHKARYYVNIDPSARPLGEKVRDAQMAQCNYIVIVGDKEYGTGQVFVLTRDSGTAAKLMTVDTLLIQLKDEVAAFR